MEEIIDTRVLEIKNWTNIFHTNKSSTIAVRQSAGHEVE